MAPASVNGVTTTGWLRAPRVFSALGLVAVFALPACAPTLISLGTDAAYTASEERTTDEAVDDNKIKLELARATGDVTNIVNYMRVQAPKS